MHLTATLIAAITNFIAATGYTSVIILMALESMIAPIPSEAVMPFAGFLISTGQFSFWGVIITSTIGSLIGSLLSYAMGAYGGRPIVEKYGKYLLLNKHHLELTEKFFQTKGEKTIFLSRFIPVVRHFISIPAGVGKMNIVKFSLYTVIGAGLWNAFLAYVGYSLKNNWEELGRYLKIGDVIVVVAFVGAVGYWVYKKRKNRGL